MAENNEPKSGLRTSEFWLCGLTALMSLLWGAGVLDLSDGATGQVNHWAGILAGALSALGYGISRGLSKQNPKK
tara:strand:+ start:962 stop:1183 length:222 start_codon:yes stop_codon:yes gene_type:complete